MKPYHAVLLFFLFGQTRGLLDTQLETTVDEKVQVLTQKVEQLQQTVLALQNQKANHTGPVAFTATLSKTITSLSQHQQIVFDHVITNIGNGYNPFHGHFTAPISGVYVFFVTLTSIPNHSASVQLLKNGQWIGHALADDSTSNYVTTTIAVTAQLQLGDQVWVQNEYSYSTAEEVDGGNWSSFSGHLVGAN